MGQLLNLDCRWLTQHICSGNLQKKEKKSNREVELEKLDAEGFVIVLTTTMLLFLPVPLDLKTTNQRSCPENSLYIHFLKTGNTELYQKARQGIAMDCFSIIA